LTARISDIVVVEMSHAREKHPPVLLLAAVLEALVASGQPTFTEADLDTVLSWLAEPARSETLRELHRNGWLEADPAGGTHALTAAGRQVYEAFRRAALPEFPGGLTPEQIVRALLHRSLEELAAAGREALVPVLPAPPLLTTKAVVREAETHALHGGPELDG
jgi:hypothetical protein